MNVRTLMLAPMSGWPVSLRVTVPVIVPAISGRTRSIPAASPAVTSTRVALPSVSSAGKAVVTNVFSVLALMK